MIFANRSRLGGLFISEIALYLSGLTLSVVLSWSVIWALRDMRNGVQVSFLKIYYGTKQVGPPTFFGELHDMSMRYMLEGVVCVAILGGIGFSLYYLWETVLAFGQLMVFRKLLHLLRRAFLWTSKIISHQCSEFDFSTPIWAEETVDVITKFYRFMRRFGVHISVFTIAAIICAVPAVFFLGVPFRIFHRTETKGEFIAVMVFGILVAGLMGGVFCVGLARSIRQVCRPFYQDLEDPYRERMLFEI
ncbi:hypothetical protein M413DRAFT_14835 [Hebeloma cylindrosporum]|uniref:Uncharacterized protein n=1 Tax=Hebeloma cylindrosporum TaxID=76867 RepID=A0A0C3BS81_HEBCY|nr:hypothetical protein M413DRAFT_14835 [Hebeloma cylindrosporum h7]